ncbi:gamma-butyrobetaine hydroxylase [Sporothrix brasiliensis 5110]|uniref:Gamma-butyrobetaine hydroxylase n=1 Tax=Sporothrix brasiliensis 5110 TaxID=1398154 RepID=A0A0C2F7Y1_9PEZI|nr:gamma-butyrobetaine hydroxylase [Sporothrix brasiliensis 5110]KIH87128.1 gamma-butyrobetaine hydroxylase [Sporothrix brasiliensis 5110]
MLSLRRAAAAPSSAMLSRLARSATASALRRAPFVSQVRGVATDDNSTPRASPDEPQLDVAASTAYVIVREPRGRPRKPLAGGPGQGITRRWSKPKEEGEASGVQTASTGEAQPSDQTYAPHMYNMGVLRKHVIGKPTRAKPSETGPAIDGIVQSVEYASQTDELILQFRGVRGPVRVSTLWLRDTCACPTCVTASSGQKSFHTHDLPRSPRVQECTIVTDPASLRTSLRVVWDPTPNKADVGTEAAGAVAGADTHASLFDTQELLFRLAQLDPPNYPGQLERRLWDRTTIEAALKPVSYADWMAPDDGSNAEFYRALLDLHALGILIVDGVPESETAVRQIAEQIGNIQNTFYGETFDVVSKPNAENVAYSNVFLCLHQDLLYMNDPPYIQLLHCLRNDCDGGESLFSDSVRAATEMQVCSPEKVQVLTRVPVRYHYERNGHYYYNARPVLELERDGGARSTLLGAERAPLGRTGDRIKQTAWSPPFQDSMPYDLTKAMEFPAWLRSANPVSYPHPRDKLAATSQATRLALWHDAAAEFSERLEDPRAMLELKLQPGQCVLFNNRRVLHGRRQFNASAGTRWLKGTYIDEQTFQSRLTDMVRRGRVPGQETTEAEREARPTNTPPFGPFPRPSWVQGAMDRSRVVEMMKEAGRPVPEGTRQSQPWTADE